ncbi:MAG: MOSC domain-containing protein [Luteimonas sp.]
MRLGGLYRYPVKSCAPLPAAAAAVEARGLAHDRRWMVVDPAGGCITGRELPRLTLVRAEPAADGALSLQAPGMAPLRVAAPAGDARLPVTVWKSDVLARPCDAAADAWLSAFLGCPVRLVHMDAGVHRPMTSSHAQPGDEVSFADAYPMLLVTRAAVDLLNTKLARPVSVLRFRPNFVVDGAPAHAEDAWSRIRVGEVEFEVGKACVRCVFTTVDPERGERDPGGEPLRTLVGYRRGPEGVTFGRNLIPRSPGTVRLGDAVEVIA